MLMGTAKLYEYKTFFFMAHKWATFQKPDMTKTVQQFVSQQSPNNAHLLQKAKKIVVMVSSEPS